MRSRMRWLPIVLSAALAAGCGGPPREAEPEGSGEAIKISYFRSNPNPRNTTEREPTYKVVMSQTWQERLGDSPREPFSKAAPGRVFMGLQPDAVLRDYVNTLRGFGLDRLVASAPESYKPHELYQRAMDNAESPYTRILTVGTDKQHRSYYYRDQQGDKELIEIFVKCETFISRVVEYSIMVETGADPFFRK